jgi:DNA polymerase-1
MPKLMLVDGNSLVHRAYHAIPPLSNSKGEPTNAVFGFASMILSVLATEKPDHVVVAFDIGKTFRHDEAPEYKSQRPPTPEDLKVQFARVREIVDAMGFATAQKEGFEADDVLGTLAAQASAQGVDSLIVTGDTDTLQLVGPHTRILTSRRGFSDTVVYDEDAVRQRYGLAPDQLADLRGLRGDPTDNIPNVPGVGDVTASKLLQQFGSVENLLVHLDEVEPKLRAKLAPYAEQVHKSKHLATIVTDVPVTLDLAGSHSGRYDRDRMVALFRDLEFRSLVERLPRSAAGRTAPAGAAGDGAAGARPAGRPLQQMALFGGAAAATERSSAALPVRHHLVNDANALDALVRRLKAAGSFALDTETTGTDARHCDLVGLSVAVDGEEGWYIPASMVTPGSPLVRLLEDAAVPKVAHNAKFDLTVLAAQAQGIAVGGLDFDTMVAAYLLNEKGVGLKDLAFTRLNMEMTPISDLIGKGKSQITMAQAPPEQVAAYASADAAVTWLLKEVMAPQLREQDLWQLFTEVEMPLAPVLVQMERDGVALDVPALQKMSRDLFERVGELEGQIYDAVGHRFNINSTQQLASVLFEELKLDKARRTKTGYSTDSAVLEELRGKHAVVELILEHRQLTKLKSTYVDALPLLVDPHDGRVHTSYNQTVTSTGRLSSSDPNLQNIPIRTDLGKQVRAAFVASPGSVLLAADYSQVELRILAHISQDPTLLATFERGEDVHSATAAVVFDVPLNQVTAAQRRVAKGINFGIVYGMGDFGLAQRTDLDQKDASRFIADYFGHHPGVKGYLDETKRLAKEQGYVSTLLGRRRYLPELKNPNRAVVAAAERMAVNMPIQGTAADIIKIAMVRLHKAIREHGFRSRMILQVHDELIFEVPEDELAMMKPLVQDLMENALPMSVHLKVDLKEGHNWGEV